VIEAATFITELLAKNQAAIDRLVGGYLAAIEKEGFGIADVLKVELKIVIEAAEVAALWTSDSEDLDFKLAMASQCGDRARHYHLIRGRLEALGVDLTGTDPRQGGYSKLFAFQRSLQTTEERACAGGITARTLSIARAGVLADWCDLKEDAETARLYRDALRPDDQRHYEAGRNALLKVAIGEESQARARRAAYRVIELVGELQEPNSLRKILARTKK